MRRLVLERTTCGSGLGDHESFRSSVHFLDPAGLRRPGGRRSPGCSKRGVSGQIERLTQPQARAGLLSGAILVQRGERVIFQRAFGFASWELSVANSDHTLFGVGSLTKPMAQAVASLLVAQHRLGLRAPVEQYIPGFPRGPSGGKPTIEQLLKHTAGIPHRVTTAAEEVLPRGFGRPEL